MVPPGVMEGWLLRLDSLKGSQGCLPNPNRRVCDGKSNCKRTTAQSVGAHRVNETESNRRKSKTLPVNNSQVWHTSAENCGRIPRNEETGTEFWRKALGKQMAKVKLAWRTADGVSPEQARTGKESTIIGFQEIRCHVIFDVKLDFTRKSRFVAGGHKTDTPGSITYSSVVSRDSVRLAFLIAGLNDLDVLAGDVTNAYLNAKCREKISFEGGIETDEDRGKVLIVTRALYGLKSSGAAWRADLAVTLRDLKFTSSQADPDVWLLCSSGTHYDMILVYVDEVLNLRPLNTLCPAVPSEAVGYRAG